MVNKKSCAIGLIFLAVGVGFVFSEGYCREHGSYSGSTRISCASDAAPETYGIKDYKDVLDDATTVGETAGVIYGYAANSSSFNEFADNIADHEFTSESLQDAQELGKAIGDVVADVYIWATDEDEN
jgi:hypothetical protein